MKGTHINLERKILAKGKMPTGRKPVFVDFSPPFLYNLVLSSFLSCPGPSFLSFLFGH